MSNGLLFLILHENYIVIGLLNTDINNPHITRRNNTSFLQLPCRQKNGRMIIIPFFLDIIEGILKELRGSCEY